MLRFLKRNSRAKRDDDDDEHEQTKSSLLRAAESFGDSHDNNNDHVFNPRRELSLRNLGALLHPNNTNPQPLQDASESEVTLHSQRHDPSLLPPDEEEIVFGQTPGSTNFYHDTSNFNEDDDDAAMDDPFLSTSVIPVVAPDLFANAFGMLPDNANDNNNNDNGNHPPNNNNNPQHAAGNLHDGFDTSVDAFANFRASFKTAAQTERDLTVTDDDDKPEFLPKDATQFLRRPTFLMKVAPTDERLFQSDSDLEFSPKVDKKKKKKRLAGKNKSNKRNTEEPSSSPSGGKHNEEAIQSPEPSQRRQSKKSTKKSKSASKQQQPPPPPPPLYPPPRQRKKNRKPKEGSSSEEVSLPFAEILVQDERTDPEGLPCFSEPYLSTDGDDDLPADDPVHLLVSHTPAAESSFDDIPMTPVRQRRRKPRRTVSRNSSGQDLFRVERPAAGSILQKPSAASISSAESFFQRSASSFSLFPGSIAGPASPPLRQASSHASLQHASFPNLQHMPSPLPRQAPLDASHASRPLPPIPKGSSSHGSEDDTPAMKDQSLAQVEKELDEKSKGDDDDDDAGIVEIETSSSSSGSTDDRKVQPPNDDDKRDADEVAVHNPFDVAALVKGENDRARRISSSSSSSSNSDDDDSSSSSSSSSSTVSTNNNNDKSVRPSQKRLDDSSSSSDDDDPQDESLPESDGIGVVIGSVTSYEELTVHSDDADNGNVHAATPLNQTIDSGGSTVGAWIANLSQQIVQGSASLDTAASPLATSAMPMLQQQHAWTRDQVLQILQSAVDELGTNSNTNEWEWTPEHWAALAFLVVRDQA